MSTLLATPRVTVGTRPLEHSAQAGVLPAIIHAHDVPGSLCLGQLQKRGILTMLDSTAGFLTSSTRTLYGRAAIAQHLIPAGTVAAQDLAFWVWNSGKLPAQTSVISSSHYRSTIFGRKVSVMNRGISANQLHRIDKLVLTSPLRTACDIACENRDDFEQKIGLKTFCDFLQHYEITVTACRKLLLQNSRWPGFSNALNLFTAIQRSR